jgi:phosphoribosyl 1,2-cyclic phosphate phosphodiesterase
MIEMHLTLLGTGNAAGMPLYGCDCSYCSSAKGNSSLQRGPCCAMLEIQGKRYLIDAGQVNLHERFPAGSIDGILVTHFHPDHVQGLFHLRWGVNQIIPVYTPPDSEGCADLYKHAGILDFRPQKKFQSFELSGIRVTPLPLIHSKPTFGYLFENGDNRIAYLTDTKGLPPSTQERLSELDLDVMIIDCSFAPGVDKKGHNNLDEVIAISEVVQPKQTVLTHIGHDFDIWLQDNAHDLPVNFIVGQDGLNIFHCDHV